MSYCTRCLFARCFVYLCFGRLIWIGNEYPSHHNSACHSHGERWYGCNTCIGDKHTSKKREKGWSSTTKLQHGYQKMSQQWHLLSLTALRNPTVAAYSLHGTHWRAIDNKVGKSGPRAIPDITSAVALIGTLGTSQNTTSIEIRTLI